jgi:isoleucyl-tRNA synthetase
MGTEKSEGVFSAVRSELDFPGDERRRRDFWREHQIFEKTLSAETRATGPSKGTFVFYEGPPTANGMPHNGHVLTRAIKDLFPRFQTMRGYDVPRKAGWDTHGLPVEVEVEKDLGIHGKADIEAHGIKPFISNCIESVFRYTEAWERNTEQLGYWVDLEDAYVTYHKSYVESVWWALSELHQKGLLYRGHKVVWWWPQGGTALSAGEVGQNYKTVDDPSCYAAFELEDDPNTFLCVWTTTPWTLPSNGYAAVKSSYDYVKVAWKDGKHLIVADKLREVLAKKTKLDLEVVATIKGSELVGRRYRPCHDTFTKTLWDTKAKLRDGGERALYWRVLDEDFVTLDSGTGIVHIAPAFGEDDNTAHRVQMSAYAEIEDLPLICSVAPDGTLTDVMGELAGTWVKDADKPIVADLDARGLLVHFEKYRHEYPFCWRANDDPLIQLARPAWYIRTTSRIDDAIANNQQIRWLPEHIKDGRFGDFLANNVDWALSRERFWGTPLNVWVCDGCGAEHAPHSVAAIEEKNPDAFAHFHAAKKQDPSLNEHLIVHKPWIDEVTFGCDACDGTMRRVTEVIDCWFDSGCMPFAQFGFPHIDGSHAVFDRAFPADFISEAIDQTRGWFYSLLMVSTMLFDEATCAKIGIVKRDYPYPYKSCVVLGHVSDREGKKESKSYGNYTPPDVVLERVRMEFAALARDDADLAKLAGGKLATKVAAADETTVFIAREDYDGLDLSGASTDMRVYRGDREDSAKTLTLTPLKGLSRRVLVLSTGQAGALGVEQGDEGLAIKPSNVPRLAQNERLFVEDPSRPAPGADAFRWFFYSASPPWTNTRHSLSNVRLAQKDFTIKLRNVFSFFCIYANIDGFSPAAGNAGASETTPKALVASEGYRPASERSLLDRWITSEVALAVGEVADKLDALLCYDAAQRLITLVDAVSNWYVRRSRERFWANAADPAVAQDKLDASWTLYETLVTIAKAIAPFVPYFAEEMYQNLVRGPWPQSQPLSVHLCAYPIADATQVDAALAEDMAMVRELVSLGLQVRSDNKLRVRQPLDRADIVVNNKALAGRLAAYEALIRDELNVKAVRWLMPGQEGEEISYELKPNFRALGPRLGKKVQAVKKALATADAGAVRTSLATDGKVAVELETRDGKETVELDGAEVQVAVVASDGFAAAGGRAGVVVLHTELTPALLDEGLAREVLARLQGQRKQLALGYTDRIVVTIHGDERVQRVVEAYRDHLIGEALCSELKVSALEADDDDALEIQESRLSIRVDPA